MQLLTATSRRDHARQVLALIVVGFLIACVTADPARAVGSLPDGIERSLPSAERIIQDQRAGADNVERAARQFMALNTMNTVAGIIARTKYPNERPSFLMQRIASYQEAASDVERSALARFKTQGCNGPKCGDQRFYLAAQRLQTDAAFRRQLLERYLSKDLIAAVMSEENRQFQIAMRRAEEARRRKENGSASQAVGVGLLIVVGAVAAFFLYMLRQKEATPAGPPLSGNYGTAAFAPVEQQPRTATAARTGVFLGRSWAPELPPQAVAMTAPIYTKPESHTLVVAPTRTGKGTRIIIPTLLRYGGSVLTIDPKGENAAITARAREKLGQKVYLINPWGELSQEFAKRGFGASATYNPLDILDRRDPNVVANAQTLAEVICPPPQGDRDSYWQGSATELLCAILLWLTDQPDEQKTLGRARDIIGQSRKDMSEKFLTRMVESTAFDGAIRNFASPFVDLADQTYSSVISTLSVYTRFLSDPQVKASTAKSSFSMRELIDRDTSVYLVIPPNRMATQATWLRLLLTSAMQTMKDHYRHSAGARRCLFLIDELPALGRLPDLTRDISTISGYGLDMVLIVQNLDQLKANYGDDGAATIISNCAWKWFCNINNHQTAKTLSDTLGQATRRTVQTGESTGQTPGGESAGRTTTYGEMGRFLKNPDELMTLGRDIAIGLQPEGPPLYLNPVDYWHLEAIFGHLKQAYPGMYWTPPLAFDPNPYQVKG